MKRINKILLELYTDRNQLAVVGLLAYISSELNGLIPHDPHLFQATAAIIGAVIVAGASIYVSAQQAKAAKKATKEANDMKKAEGSKLDTQKAEYMKMEFKNPFANMKNMNAGLQTEFENTYEDLTVNTQQADFQAQQGNQQRSNIMNSLAGAAGGSGIASLAQSMANSGAMQTQQISASIGQQESRNQTLKAQGAAGVQAMENSQNALVAQGADKVQTAQMQGDQWVQQAGMDRQATLLGMQMGQTTGANMAASQAQANQMNANAATNQALIGGLSNVVSAGVGNMNQPAPTGGGSDRRLKKNINKIGKSPSGLNMYSFEYKDSKYGKGLFQGVMSDEIPQEAVSVKDGYDRVDYSMLDVEFKQI